MGRRVQGSQRRSRHQAVLQRRSGYQTVVELQVRESRAPTTCARTALLGEVVSRSSGFKTFDLRRVTGVVETTPDETTPVTRGDVGRQLPRQPPTRPRQPPTRQMPPQSVGPQSALGSPDGPPVHQINSMIKSTRTSRSSMITLSLSGVPWVSGSGFGVRGSGLSAQG